MAKKYTPIVFAMPGNEEFARLIGRGLDAEAGMIEIHDFPDGETYLRVLSDVKGRVAVVVCTLFRPNEKLAPLYFMGKTLKSLGAAHVCLAVPYLAYMRQDKAFQPGEAVTSEHFAGVISSFADSIVTVDSHLHRYRSLSEIYPIPNKNASAAGHIAEWVRINISDPVLIGPDSESEPWVAEVAQMAGAPFVVLEKTRRGDRDVSVSEVRIDGLHRGRTPVLVDDIISTARTMIETVRRLSEQNMAPAVCIGVHAVFAGDAYNELMDAGATRIVTCNTIPHPSNLIDVSELFIDFVNEQL